MSGRTLKVGTRESQLARTQTDLVLNALRVQHPNVKVEIVPVRTEGDKTLNKPLREFGGVGVFVKELEERLLSKELDFVVHSLKDLPTTVAPGLHLAATLMREDPRDVLLSREELGLMQLPKGSKIATSSLRRIAQLQLKRNDLSFVDVRGNVPTRIKKLDDGAFDAIVLAAAGLARLGLSDRITEYLDQDTCLPAVGQGALCVECRADDELVLSILASVNDPLTSAHITAERAFLKHIGGGCAVPVGALGEFISSKEMRLSGCIAYQGRVIRGEYTDFINNAEALGLRLAKDLMNNGGSEILSRLKPDTKKTVAPP